MKTRTLVKGVLAFAAASLIGAAAHAQTSTQQGDMVFTVNSDGSYTGNGSGEDLEFDLGNFTKFEPGGADFSLGNAVTISAVNTADLVTVFGASWDAQTDLVWSAVATNYTDIADYPGLPANTIFGTENKTTSVPTETAGTVQSSTALINDMVSGLNDQSQTYGTPAAQLASSDAAALSTGDPSGFNGDSGNAAPYFEANALGTHFTQPTNGTTVDYLYEFQPGVKGTEVGYFTLSSSNLTFTAVPEPSTWASIVIGAAVLVGIRFRRRRA